MPFSEAEVARFLTYVDERGPDDCWLWLGGKSKGGYGAFHFRQGAAKRTTTASRAAFAIRHGRWPNGDACHDCDNPPCCNPAHISEGSRAENMAQAKARNRTRVRTHCPHGHEYTASNTYLHPNGGKICCACWGKRPNATKEKVDG